MDSHLTVADLRTALARFGYGTADFLRRLNRSSEHYLNSEVFADLFTVVQVSTTTGYVTNPRQFGRAYGLIQGDLSMPIFSRWIEFIEYGIGRQDPNNMILAGLTDVGNHYCTQSEVWSAGVQQSGTLRVKIDNALDAPKVVRFDGTDSSDLQVIDTTGSRGSNLTLASPSADTTQVFKELQGIQLPANMLGRCTLWKVISGVETQIGVYEPGETRPRYTRYKIGKTSDTLRLYCRRKHVPYVAETDWVYPSNADAHEFGFLAQTYRDRGEFKTENEAWMQGKKVLKEEYAATVPYPRVMLTSEDFGNFSRQIW